MESAMPSISFGELAKDTELPLRKGGNTLWSNRVQELKKIWLTPDMGN